MILLMHYCVQVDNTILCVLSFVIIIFIYLLLFQLIFGIGNFWMRFCLMLMYVNVAKLHLFKGLHVSVIGQD